MYYVEKNSYYKAYYKNLIAFTDLADNWKSSKFKPS